MGGGGEVKALLVFRALAYAVGKTKCAFTCGWFFFCRLVYNGYVYETFGISKHFPVKLKLRLIRAETFDNALTAKCFIYDVSGSGFFTRHTQLLCLCSQ